LQIVDFDPLYFNNTNDQSLGKLVREQLVVVLQQIANPPDQSQFVDCRQDLFPDATNIGSCISLNDALQRTISIRISFIWIQKRKELGDKLRRLWSHC